MAKNENTKEQEKAAAMALVILCVLMTCDFSKPSPLHGTSAEINGIT